MEHKDRQVRQALGFFHRPNQQRGRLRRQAVCVFSLAVAMLIGGGCQVKSLLEENKVSAETTGTDTAGTQQKARETDPVVVPGLGVQMELADHSLEGSSFYLHGVPTGYRIWATITDGSYENYLVFDNNRLHVAEIRVRYDPGKRPRVAPMERYKLHFRKLPEFPVWEAQMTAGQTPAPGLVTEFTDGRFGYNITTRGEQPWLLDGWTFKSTEALSCTGPEMCPEYRCICGYSATGRPRIATGGRLACIDGRCVAPESCDEFCLSIDFTEQDFR